MTLNPTTAPQRFATGCAAAVSVSSDNEAVEATVKQVKGRTYAFVWTQMMELSTFMYDR